MKFKKAIIKGDMPGHVKVKKAAMISIAFNILEIIAGLTMIVLVNRMLAGGVDRRSAENVVKFFSKT